MSVDIVKAAVESLAHASRHERKKGNDGAANGLAFIAVGVVFLAIPIIGVPLIITGIVKLCRGG